MRKIELDPAKMPDLDKPIEMDVVFVGGKLDGRKDKASFKKTTSIVVTVVGETYKFKEPNIFEFFVSEKLEEDTPELKGKLNNGTAQTQPGTKKENTKKKG